MKGGGVVKKMNEKVKFGFQKLNKMKNEVSQKRVKQCEVWVSTNTSKIEVGFQVPDED